MKKAVLKLFAVVIAAAMTLCSCGQIGEAASQLAGAVVSSAGAELSSAMSEGAADLAEGMNELKSGLNEMSGAVSSAVSEGADEFSNGMEELKDGLGEVSSGLESAGGVVSEHIGNIAGDIGSRVSDGLSEIPQVIESVQSEVSGELSEIADNVGSELSEAAEKITTAASSEDTTTAPKETKTYKFRNQKRYDEHYEKHGAEFGNITKEEYLQLANDLINSDSDRVLHKYSDDGDYMYFDQDTNYFLVLSEDGYIRTFFIPTAGINYWNRQ
ncbi:MAG: hypothetical protein IK990_05055 [Ruminiclostridium sp.]|nr:hypothetical protein [Ruminiclostridium sp.]